MRDDVENYTLYHKADTSDEKKNQYHLTSPNIFKKESKKPTIPCPLGN